MTKYLPNFLRISGTAIGLLTAAPFLSASADEAGTDPRCYDKTNAGTVGQIGWSGCEGMYIVSGEKRSELKHGFEIQNAVHASNDDGYKITYKDIEYTFGYSANNIFTGQIRNMQDLFYFDTQFNENISYWDTSNVIDMSRMFSGAISFNQYIGDWNTSKVNNMSSTFSKAASFNQHIGDWDTSNVEDMSRMFSQAYAFNQNIVDWNTSKVQNMYQMFGRAVSFNQYIGDWDTANVETMRRMFIEATNFNQYIGDWDTSNVSEMGNMFDGAESFNQDLSAWNVQSVTNSEAFDESTSEKWTDEKKPIWGTTGVN